jgi:hypothetical protein
MKHFFEKTVIIKNGMKKGDRVHWNWGKSQAEGTIKERSETPITKKIKGTIVKRNATKESKWKRGSKI